MTPADLAALLRNARRDAGLSQRELARVARVRDRFELSHWEHGRRLRDVAAYLSTLEACGLQITVSSIPARPESTD